MFDIFCQGNDSWKTFVVFYLHREALNDADFRINPSELPTLTMELDGCTKNHAVRRFEELYPDFYVYDIVEKRGNQ